jgi:hypothetical protein
MRQLFQFETERGVEGQPWSGFPIVISGLWENLLWHRFCTYSSVAVCLGRARSVQIGIPVLDTLAMDEKESKNGFGTSELDRLAQFFPNGTRVKMPVQVMRLPLGSWEAMATVLEYGTSREVIFRCEVPVEFGERLRLTNRDRSLDAEAEVTAVQIGASETLVAARFTAEIPNWIIKS